MTRAVTPATLGVVPYHQDDDEPNRANMLGIGLTIAAALIAAVVLVIGAVWLAAYVVITTAV